MIRLAKEEELPILMDIYEVAKKDMIAHGNKTQWTSSYPSQEIIQKDIIHKTCYVIEKDAIICGVFTFLCEDDPSYQTIFDGKWRSTQAYGVIHRLASNGKSHGIFKECITFCKKKISYLRIDTHVKNEKMKHLILSNGFCYCGKIIVEDGTERMAYDFLEDVN